MDVIICKKLACLALFLVLGMAGYALFPMVQSAWAGPGPPGHTHGEEEVGREEILIRSKAYLRRLVVNGKIEPAWETLEPATIEQQNHKGTEEWVVTFENSEADSEDKKTLYIFFTLNGQVIAANFSGI
jgi:hypothetical protein